MLGANSRREIVEYPDHDISGSGQTKTILLLHGVVVTRKMWIPQMIALNHTYQVLAPDLLGHGSRSREKFTFSEAVAELNKTIEENKYGKVLLVGFSLGGYLASEFACKYPDKTNGLVIVGSSTTPRGYISIPYHLLAFLYRLANPEWLAKRDARSWQSRYGAEIAEPVIEAGFYHAAIPALRKEIGGKDFLAGLKSYDKPVFIMNGEKDRIFRKGEGLYRDKLRNSKVVVIKQAGHMCNLDAPEEFNRYLIEFADSLEWN